MEQKRSKSTAGHYPVFKRATDLILEPKLSIKAHNRSPGSSNAQSPKSHGSLRSIRSNPFSTGLKYVLMKQRIKTKFAQIDFVKAGDIEGALNLETSKSSLQEYETLKNHITPLKGSDMHSIESDTQHRFAHSDLKLRSIGQEMRAEQFYPKNLPRLSSFASDQEGIPVVASLHGSISRISETHHRQNTFMFKQQKSAFNPIRKVDERKLLNRFQSLKGGAYKGAFRTDVARSKAKSTLEVKKEATFNPQGSQHISIHDEEDEPNAYTQPEDKEHLEADQVLREDGTTRQSHATSSQQNIPISIYQSVEHLSKPSEDLKAEPDMEHDSDAMQVIDTFEAIETTEALGEIGATARSPRPNMIELELSRIQEKSGNVIEEEASPELRSYTKDVRTPRRSPKKTPAVELPPTIPHLEIVTTEEDQKPSLENPSSRAVLPKSLCFICNKEREEGGVSRRVPDDQTRLGLMTDRIVGHLQPGGMDLPPPAASIQEADLEDFSQIVTYCDFTYTHLLCFQRFKGCARQFCQNHGTIQTHQLLTPVSKMSCLDKLAYRATGKQNCHEIQPQGLGSLEEQEKSLEILKAKLEITTAAELEWTKTIKYCQECEPKFVQAASSWRLMDVSLFKLVLFFIIAMLVIILIILLLPRSQSELSPTTPIPVTNSTNPSNTTETNTTKPSNETDSTPPPIETPEDASPVYDFGYLNQTQFTSLPSLNECQGEFLSKNVKLYNEYLNLHAYSFWPLECRQKTDFFMFKINRPSQMKEFGDPRDNSPPDGFRYIYYDELTTNQDLKANLFSNLKEQNNTDSVGLVNGWTDGTEIFPQCGNSASAKDLQFFMIIDECYPLPE